MNFAVEIIQVKQNRKKNCLIVLLTKLSFNLITCQKISISRVKYRLKMATVI